jgi:hypothetical protein
MLVLLLLGWRLVRCKHRHHKVMTARVRRMRLIEPMRTLPDVGTIREDMCDH